MRLTLLAHLSAWGLTTHPHILVPKEARTHPEFPAEDDDFPPRLLLPEPPLHQVLAVLSRQGHVASGHRWVGGTWKWVQR